MSNNMSPLDRIVRIALAFVIAALYVSGGFDVTTNILMGIVAAVFLVTGITGFCPLYMLLNISSNRPTHTPGKKAHR